MTLLNLRDVSVGIGPSPLRPGRLFRSGQPVDLTEADVEPMTAAGLRTVVDLRDPGEAIGADWSLLAERGVRVVRIPLAEQVMAGRPQGITIDPLGLPEGTSMLGLFYASILSHASAGLAEVVRTVATGVPVDVHCAAGKDRTGVSVALLLNLLGVDDEAIVADYLLTQQAMPAVIDQLMSTYAAQARSVGVRPEAIPPEFLQAPEPAIRTLLAHLHAAGDARTYLHGAGCTEGTLDEAVAALTL